MMRLTQMLEQPLFFVIFLTINERIIINYVKDINFANL
jgi:hypothetical protein